MWSVMNFLCLLSLNLDHFLLVIGWNTLKVTDERECKVAISMQVGSDRFFVFLFRFLSITVLKMLLLEKSSA